MRGRLNGHKFCERFKAHISAHEFSNVRQLLIQHLFSEVGQVEVDIVLPVDAASLADFLVNGARGHIARSQVLERGGVALHEALARSVSQDGAFPARRLAQQNTHLVNACGMELEEFHVL